MTKTNNSSSSDSEMTDAYQSYQKSSDKHDSTANRKISIKFVFKLKKNDKVDIAKYHRDILIELENVDKKAIVCDNKDTTFTPNATLDFRPRFEYHTFQRKHIQICCVCHDITTRLTFSNLKEALRNVLIACRATVTVNTWTTLDVCDIGWLLFMHPRFHNRDDLSKRFQSLLEKISDKPIPQFHLYSKTVFAGKPNKAQRISASAIHIECESNNLFELCELFHKLYSSTKNVLPRKFIPMNIPHLQNQSTYSNIIHQQHHDLRNLV